MGDDTLAIRSYAEAVAAAMGMSERYGYGHAAAALDAHGSLIDLTVFHEPHQTIYDALFYAHGLMLFDPSVTRLVLLSALRRDVSGVKERDIETLRGAQRLFGESGVEIVDWVQTDGSLFRSVGVTTEHQGVWRDVA
jgi:hypothetical protein